MPLRVCIVLSYAMLLRHYTASGGDDFVLRGLAACTELGYAATSLAATRLPCTELGYARVGS
eukprot:1248131-Rhodomonas_salina.1